MDNEFTKLFRRALADDGNEADNAFRALRRKIVKDGVSQTVAIFNVRFKYSDPLLFVVNDLRAEIRLLQSKISRYHSEQQDNLATIQKLRTRCDKLRAENKNLKAKHAEIKAVLRPKPTAKVVKAPT